MTDWAQLNDELRARRGIRVGGTDHVLKPPPVGRLGAGVAGTHGAHRRLGVSGEVNAILRQAHEERQSRNRSYELPVGALFSRGRR